jgi:hypothetical protein
MLRSLNLSEEKPERRIYKVFGTIKPKPTMLKGLYKGYVEVIYWKIQKSLVFDDSWRPLISWYKANSFCVFPISVFVIRFIAKYSSETFYQNDYGSYEEYCRDDRWLANRRLFVLDVSADFDIISIFILNMGRFRLNIVCTKHLVFIPDGIYVA